MRKILLSTVATATLATMAYANTDTELAALKKQMAAMMEKIEALETKKAEEEKAKEAVTVKESKVPVLEFSGKHYLGFKSDSESDTNKFETRRNYFQVKGFFEDNPKSYMRITLDTFHNDEDDGEDEGSWEVRLKYAFLYLDSILPYTGVEIGQAHRPWIDHEEHGGWNYRSISKVFVEDDNGAHLTNSADLGVNFKTKTPYFSSELGLFNGEGYHGVEDGEGLSSEWRLTAHLLGTGTEKRKDKVTYADVSFFGQWNEVSNKHGNEDLNWYGVHGVFNHPNFLLAGQYVATEDAANIALGSTKDYAGEGWSVNGEIRPMKDFGIIGRYDCWELDSGTEKERTIAGLTYQYNKNVEFIANWLKEEVDSVTETDAIMLTAEVNW